MEVSKKRKTGDSSTAAVAPPPALSPEDARKILDPLSKDQLVDVLQTVLVRDGEVLDAVRSVADADLTLRKLFVRSLGPETTTENLRSFFSSFGELADSVVVTDKASGKTKGYGFVTFKHIDGAILALKEPNKKIDGRITVARLAAGRDHGNTDVWRRKVYVGNVPLEISTERLLDYFSAFGEIEEGPLGFDKLSGKPRGFAFFIYKTEDGAKACLFEPLKNINGYQIHCKLAADGKNSKAQGLTEMPGDAVPLRGGLPSFSGFAGGPPLRSHQNPQLSSAMPLSIGGGPGFRYQGPPGSGVGSSGGSAAVGYGGGGGGGGSGFGRDEHYGGRVAPRVYPDLTNYGSSMNRLPPSFGGYPDVGHYASQAQLPPAGPRGPSGGSFQGGPPFY